MNRMKLFIRILLDILVIMIVVNGWWFVAIPLCIIGILMNNFYFEVILLGVFYDALFRMIPDMGVWQYLGTYISTVLFLSLNYLRKIIRD